MILIYILSLIVSLLVTYLIIYFAVKNALSSYYGQRDDKIEKLLERLISNDSKVPSEEIILPEDKNEILRTNERGFAVQENSEGNVSTFNLKNGDLLEVNSYLLSGYTSGDKVFINGKAASTGKYKIGMMDYIIVENGQIK